jgi:hypothetical protein
MSVTLEIIDSQMELTLPFEKAMEWRICGEFLEEQDPEGNYPFPIQVNNTKGEPIILTEEGKTLFRKIVEEDFTEEQMSDWVHTQKKASLKDVLNILVIVDFMNHETVSKTLSKFIANTIRGKTAEEVDSLFS